MYLPDDMPPKMKRQLLLDVATWGSCLYRINPDGTYTYFTLDEWPADVVPLARRAEQAREPEAPPQPRPAR